MRKTFFYASHALAIVVFFAFYAFMLWAIVDMGNQMLDFGATFWTGLTEAGFVILAAVGLVLFLVASYNAIIRGMQPASPEAQAARLRHAAQRPLAPNA